MNLKDDKDLLKQGEDLFASGNLSEAEECFKKILAKDPRHIEALNDMGVVAFLRSDFKRALDYFKKTLKLDQRYPKTIENYSKCLIAMGDHLGALNFMRDSFKLGVMNTELLNLMGKCFMELKDFKSAKAVLEKSLSLDADQPDREPVKEALIHLKLLIEGPPQDVEKAEKPGGVRQQGDKTVSNIGSSASGTDGDARSHTLNNKLNRLKDKTGFRINIISISDLEADKERRLRWGDHWVKEELEKEFMAAGHIITDKDPDIIFHMFGAPLRFVPADTYNIIWIHSHPDWITPEILRQYDRIYCLSPRFIQKISGWGIKAETLIGATAKKPARAEKKYDIVFVGNTKGPGGRKIINDLGKPGYNIKIWGEGWQDKIPPEWFGGLYYKNEDLSELYASSSIVLNDHHEDMRRNGFLNPRILDIFASGSLAVSDYLEGAEEIFGGCLPRYKTPRELLSIIDYYLNNPAERNKLIDTGKNIAGSYTFKKMVNDILRDIDNRLMPFRNEESPAMSNANAGNVDVIKASVNDRENFVKLHLGCGNNRFPGFINIDLNETGATDYVGSCLKLPFPDNSVELIETYHMIEHLPRHDFPKALKEWRRVLIPGGRLYIECPDFDKAVEEYINGDKERINNIFGLQRFPGDTHLWGYNLERLKMTLEQEGFRGVSRLPPRDYHRLEEPCFAVEAYKSIDRNLQDMADHDGWGGRIQKRPETVTLEWRERHIHYQILKEMKEEIFTGKQVISLGCGSGELESLMARDGFTITGVDTSDTALRIAEAHKKDLKLDKLKFLNGSIDGLPFPDDSFDSGFAIEVFEHIEPEKLTDVFREVRRVLRPDGRFLITLPNKSSYSDPGHRQFFTKGTLTELIDRENLAVERIDLEERSDHYRKHDLLKALISNRPAKGPHQRLKICAIGGYDAYRYSQLGYHWDGQARAFDALGYETLLLDIRKDKNIANLRAKILEFNPDILWLGLVECLSLMEHLKEDIRRLRAGGCSVVYWYCDLRTPQSLDLHDLVDFMFLSNVGQLNEYKNAYNLKKVYYMPQACTPAFMHRLELEETYDLGFTGSLSNIFHKKRIDLIGRLRNNHLLNISNSVRNNIANFNSSCKITFGMNPDAVSELYTSNRLFISIGCGAFYLCEWFPGIERLAKNHEHLVWYKDDNELISIIDHYLSHAPERARIRQNAERLAHQRHTYVHRIQNMMDIINGKTDQFHGFLNDGSGIPTLS